MGGLRLRGGAVVALVVLAACASTSVGTLHVENRGGPPMVIQVRGGPRVVVPCDGGAALVVGQGGLPGLPWQLEVRRADDGVVLLRDEVTFLPRWLVQLDDEVVGGGLNERPVAGPAGPACPP